jgi:hypothetical protein
MCRAQLVIQFVVVACFCPHCLEVVLAPDLRAASMDVPLQFLCLLSDPDGVAHSHLSVSARLARTRRLLCSGN